MHLKRRKKRKPVTKSLTLKLLTAVILSWMLVFVAFVAFLLRSENKTRVYANGKKLFITDSERGQEPAMLPISENTGSISENVLREKPEVEISIKQPDGWFNSETVVKVEAKDIKESGSFTIKTAKAKSGINGSWMDITDLMLLRTSENGTVYVEITDTEGRTYEKSARITCFDYIKPTLNAAVNNGTLTVKANDTESGIKAIYVNGFEFADPVNGSILIRMEQFDTGYQYFTVQAMDNAGNISEVYRTNNPYYRSPGSSDSGAVSLPVSASPTKPAVAAAAVTDHIKTDSLGNKLLTNSGSINAAAKTKTEEKDKENKEDTEEEKTGKSEITIADQGREFYTIEAKSGKVFYLIIDRKGGSESVHFVTDITENDLLNVTDDNSATLPKNAAYPESEIPISESALPNNNTELKEEKTDLKSIFGGGVEERENEELSQNTVSQNISSNGREEEDGGKKEPNPALLYIIFAIIGAIVIGAGYYVKVVRPKQNGGFVEDEEGDEEDDFYDEDEAEKNEDDEFLKASEKEE